jgi:Holliday junction DNA helicase RuvA
MFNKIMGKLSGRSADSLYVLTGGVEWDISVPTRSLALFGSVGGEVEVFVWLHHWDEGMRLFGFPTEAERSLFLDLTKVEGIGPKQALKILSGISPQDLKFALDAGDLAALRQIPGVGPKLGQKMVLALKGKLVDVDASGSGGFPSSPWEDLVSALADMGFDRRAAEKAVRSRAASLAPGSGKEGEAELFRQALLELSSGGAQ